jgi:membrane protein YdbS with pleckstrin-like domain
MSDPFPATVEVVIDRIRLQQYLRWKWFLAWTVLPGVMGMFIGLSSSTTTIGQHPSSLSEVLSSAVLRAVFGFVAALLLAVVCYLTCSHRLARRYAEELQVSVEGSFLRIRQHAIVVSDRKLHFRSIVDYSVAQDPIMRWFGIEALQMTTTGSGPAATISIPGVKDCMKVRDMLSEIDRLRENAA